MGAALNMLAPREAEVSDASLPYDHIGYGTPLPLPREAEVSDASLPLRPHRLWDTFTFTYGVCVDFLQTTYYCFLRQT